MTVVADEDAVAKALGAFGAGRLQRGGIIFALCGRAELQPLERLCRRQGDVPRQRDQRKIHMGLAGL